MRNYDSWILLAAQGTRTPQGVQVLVEADRSIGIVMLQEGAETCPAPVTGELRSKQMRAEVTVSVSLSFRRRRRLDKRPELVGRGVVNRRGNVVDIVGVACQRSTNRHSKDRAPARRPSACPSLR